MKHIEIKGADELIAKLRALGKKGARKAMRYATRKGANVILKAERAEARGHVLTGNYLKGFKLSSKQKGGSVSTIAKSTAPHTFIIEFGTNERFQASGKSTGKGPALGIVGRVSHTHGPQAVDVAVTELAAKIQEFAMGDGTGGSGS